MESPATGPSYHPPDRRRPIVRKRMVAPLAVVIGAAVIVVGTLVLGVTGSPTRQGLRVVHTDGTTRMLCASVLEVSGDEPIDPGGASVVAPQWVVSDRPTDQPAPTPEPIAELDEVHTVLVDADGRLAAGRPWSAALLEADAPTELVERIESAPEAC